MTLVIISGGKNMENINKEKTAISALLQTFLNNGWMLKSIEPRNFDEEYGDEDYTFPERDPKFFNDYEIPREAIDFYFVYDDDYVLRVESPVGNQYWIMQTLYGSAEGLVSNYNVMGEYDKPTECDIELDTITDNYVKEMEDAKINW